MSAGTAATAGPAPSAVDQDGTYPRPQLLRAAWADLCGAWEFAVAPRVGSSVDDVSFDRTIEVPFPPESPASGVGETGFLPEVWYRRALTSGELDEAGLGSQGDRLVLHLGAVDHRADVWLGEHYLGGHEGGQTPFSFDVTDVVRAWRATASDEPLQLVVRAQDDPTDVTQPRGKQDWQVEPHSIWYHRTTGIWQPVWLEAVPDQHVSELAWASDVPGAAVTADVRLSRAPEPGTRVSVRIEHDGEVLAEQTVRAAGRDVRLRVDLPGQSNGQGYERLLWSPERPTLLDATVTVTADDGDGDRVASYVGLRSTAVEHGAFLLNDRPYYLRSVLEQGYWPQSHLAAPSAAALRAEVEAIKGLGFNSVRIHQKAEDPRFLYWTDRLGLAVWGETANAYAFSPLAVRRLTTEWVDLVRRDVSHPSIVTWVPLNESWGVQHGAHDAAQRHYGIGLANLTRALDPTRPVVSNDGWEHTDSDIWSVHDYSPRGSELRERYGTADAVRELLAGIGPAGRRIRLAGGEERGQPVMLTEFGGISFAARHEGDWGYSTATDAEDFAERLRDLLDAVRACPPLAGFCYTQLTDTGQETNGLLTEDREPKIPMETLRAIMTGEEA